MIKVASLIILLFSTNASTHDFNPAHLIISETSKNNTYNVSWLYPYKNIGKAADVTFEKSCNSQDKDSYIDGRYFVKEIKLTCNKSLKGGTIKISNLSVLTDALVTIKFKNNEIFESVVNNKSPIVTVPEKRIYSSNVYFLLGFQHLLGGLDHILFILGLIYLVSGYLNLFKTVTAFTIAHSITLGLSFLDLIYLPQSTIEILIAMTIVYLALEIKDDKKLSFTPWNFAFGFGLLHGMGFAGALDEIGILNDNFYTSLFLFNLGIETGQLLLLGIFGICISLFNKLNIYKYSLNFSKYSLGSLGFYWVISRFTDIIIF